MTLVFNIKPTTIAKNHQKNNYKIIPIKRIQMGIKIFENKKMGCGCGK